MEEKGKSIYDYIELFYRRKWLIVVPTVLLAVIAAAFAYRMPSYYKSSTLIIIEGQQIPEAYVKPTDQTPLASRLSTLGQQIMSRTRLEKIADEFNLYGKDASVEAPGGLLGKVIPFGEKSVPKNKEAVIEQMRRDIEVKVTSGGAVRRGGYKDADAFTVSYVSRDPRTAMEVTNTLAALFIEENLKIREQYAEGTSEFLIGELEKAKRDLEEQERTLRNFKERHMGSLPEQLDANLRTLDRLQLELQTVTDAIKNTEDKIVLLEGQLGVASLDSVTATEVEIQKLRGELTTLLSIYKENYPDVLMTKNRIKEAEARLAELKKKESGGQDFASSQAAALSNPKVFSDLSAARGDLHSLRKRERETRTQIRSYERRVENIPANEQKLADIKRDYDISLQNYKGLLEKKLNARLAENLEKRQKGERFRIIDPANLPVRPFKPDRKKIVGQGGLLGCAIGVAIALLLEFMNPAFRRPEDFNGVLPYPVLTVIPLFSATAGSGGAKEPPMMKWKIRRRQS